MTMNATFDVTPSYPNWPNVCAANLQQRIEIGGISAQAVLDAIAAQSPIGGFLPSSVVDLLLKAYEATYQADPRAAGIDEAAIQSAYAALYLILWLQTSGEFLPCVPPDEINYPDGCGDRPPWVAVDGSVVVGGTTIASPPTPNTTDPNIGEIVSGVLLAILGAAGVLFGNFAGGIETLIGGVALVVDGYTEPDWDALTCYVEWIDVYLANFYNAVHDLLKWTGIGFPYTSDLAHNAIYFNLTGLVTPPDAALNTARSVGRSAGYPASAWAPLTSSWINMPTEPLESPGEIAYTDRQQFPWHFIDGLTPTGSSSMPAPQQVNPLGQGANGVPMVRDPATFADRRARLSMGNLVSDDRIFGNAVDVSVDLIENADPRLLLDWDRDADPGYGFPTWQLPSPGSPRSSAIPET